MRVFPVIRVTFRIVLIGCSVLMQAGVGMPVTAREIVTATTTVAAATAGGLDGVPEPVEPDTQTRVMVDKSHDDEESTGHVGCPLRPEDELWVISTRQASWSGGDDPLRELVVTQRQVTGAWQPASLAELESDPIPERRTVFYVHGNRVPSHDALYRGLRIYRLLTCEQHQAPPVRLIIWSWPSDKMRGQIRDVRAKAARSDHEAWRLAAVLARLPAETHLTLIGYSFGSRIITGALANLGGAHVGGPCDAERTVGIPPSSTHVVLIAAAVNESWLSPWGWHSLAWRSIDKLVLLNNSRDPILRLYHLLERRGRPRALGSTGLGCLPEDRAERLTQSNVASEVGKTHDEAIYLQSPTVRYALTSETFSNP
jgi:hypothetical protein